MTPSDATSAPRSRRALTVGVVAALALVGPRVASADSGAIVILPASGRGVSAPFVQHARMLLVQDLTAALEARIVDYDRPPIAERLDGRRLAEIASAMGGGIALAIDVSRDAGLTTIDVTCYDALTAGLVCHARESTTAGPDTLARMTDAVTARLTQTFGVRRAASSSEPGRHAVKFGARSLVTVPIVTVDGGAQALGGVGLFLTVSLPAAFIDLDAELAAGGGRNMRSLGVGFFAALADGNRTPFCGGSVRWVGQDLGGRGASGAQARPTIGFAWGRDEIAQTRLELSYFIDLFQERTVDRLIRNSDASYTSHGPILSVGAAF